MQTDTARAASADELRRIAEFNATAVEFPDRVTLAELFELQVERHPDATAVLCDHDRSLGTASLTYAQLNDKVNRLAHRLRDEGVRPGDLIALSVERSFAMAIGVLAIIKAGAAYLPLAPDNPRDRTEYMLRDAQVRILLVHERTAARAALDGLSLVLNLDDPSAYGGSSRNPQRLNGSRDLAYVIYTSGSTGRPKGVMVEHRSVVNRLHWMQRAYPLGAPDVILQKTPYYFDVSVWELFWWALEGAQVCFLQPGGERNPLALVETIKRREVSVLHFVPSMLSVFLEYLESKGEAVTSGLTSVRRVFASGEALAPEHVKRFNQCWGAKTGARLTNLYGPTETTVDVTYFDCGPQDAKIIPIGRPIDNTRLYIIRDGREVGIGESGELCIGGVGVARGYLNNEVLTNQRFTDNPVSPGERIYRTGDIARWLPDGNVEYLGREDHQVKIRGLRIELGEIENTIREFAGVLDCVTVVQRHSESIVLIIAYVVSKEALDVVGLKGFLRTRLPDYMVPNHFERIPEMPLTPTGKADRKALPAPSLSARAT